MIFKTFLPTLATIARMNALHEVVDHFINDTEDPQHVVIAGVTNAKDTLFSSSRGKVALPEGEPVNPDSPFNLFSCTKSMTSMGILLLIDQGRLSLDTPAKEILPILDEFKIVSLEDLDVNTGEIVGKVEKPTKDITIEHLLLHTAGFAYPFNEPTYFTIASKKKIYGGDLRKLLFVPDSMPLLHEPGTNWRYGYNTDWLGLIIEEISGMKLSQFLKENIFDKAGMTHSTFSIEDPAPVIKVHQLDSEGNLRPEKRPTIPYKPRLDMGGQGCFSTLGDFMKFLRIWLNYGTSPDTGIEILKRSTVENAMKNHLPPGVGPDFILGITPEVEDPEPEGFSLIGCAINLNDLPTGRPAKCFYWGGIANSFFWIDMKNSCAGFFGCQKLPVMDEICVKRFQKFETETYRIIKGLNSKL